MNREIDCEYVVVGSGAGGGTLAGRLAQAGRSVVLLEAGGDPQELRGGDPLDPQGNRLPCDYDVPAFHGFASENKAIRWDFFVRHYENTDRQRLDWKFVEAENGVLYPRAGTLGGCTAHNAQIFVYPHNSDWQYIADLTKDPSWRPEQMRTYFQRVENCRHRRLHRWLSRIGLNPSRHGWKGWLHTESAIPLAALMDRNLFLTVADAVEKSFGGARDSVERIGWMLETWGDPNDWRSVRQNATGLRYLPLTTKNHARMGTRERVRAAEKHFGLKVELNALATKVLFQGTRAIGVEYLKGQNLYAASPEPNNAPGLVGRIRASKEVILAGGAFNTPQLLMLSGIGPRKTIEAQGIEVLVDLPGVGQNLQDRYEVAVVNRMNFPQWNLYRGAKFAPGDPQFNEWERSREGIYATNGSVLSVFKRSSVAEDAPDLFCMALLTNFRGYYPNYSESFAKDLNYLTWVVLKAHTRNRKGEVTLCSPDPRARPRISFNYFEQGGEEDLAAVVDGVRFIRKLTAQLDQGGVMTEVEPGDQHNDDEQLKTFVRNNAWGHHASCTCPIGPREEGGVLDSDFRVHGTEGLRVADASVFPRIPGVFIVSAVYMIGEKAADVILGKH